MSVWGVQGQVLNGRKSRIFLRKTTAHVQGSSMSLVICRRTLASGSRNVDEGFCSWAVSLSNQAWGPAWGHEGQSWGEGCARGTSQGHEQRRHVLAPLFCGHLMFSAACPVLPRSGCMCAPLCCWIPNKHSSWFLAFIGARVRRMCGRDLLACGSARNVRVAVMLVGRL